MPCPHTAKGTPDSIWTQISEHQFLESIDALESFKKVAGPSCLHDRARRQDEPARKLSMKVEQQLAEDLAFLAATEPGARAVAAATITEEQNSLVVHIAANSGLPLSARIEFQAIFSQLAQCAGASLTKADTESSVLASILEMDRSRILSRLRPRFHRRPRWNAQDKGPLHEAVSCACEAIANMNRRSEASRTVNEQLQDFLHRARALDSGTSNDSHDQLREVIVAACKVGDGMASLETGLESKRVSIPRAHISTIRELDKVRRYGFISNRLVSLASHHRFRDLFESATVVCLDNYSGQFSNGRERFVHAEIQLATHHRIHRSEKPPRYIGTSKMACYLCNLFIRQHKQYVEPATHGVVYEKWTVPDILEYTLEDRLDLRRIIGQMHRTIKATRRGAMSHRQFPTQSVMFHTPCISNLTIIPAQADARDEISTIANDASQPTAPLLEVKSRDSPGSGSPNPPSQGCLLAVPHIIDNAKEPGKMEPGENEEVEEDESDKQLAYIELVSRPGNLNIEAAEVNERKDPPSKSPSPKKSASQIDAQPAMGTLMLSYGLEDQGITLNRDFPEAEPIVMNRGGKRSLSSESPDNKKAASSTGIESPVLQETAERPAEISGGRRHRHRRRKNRRSARRRHKQVAGPAMRKKVTIPKIISEGVQLLKKLLCFA